VTIPPGDGVLSSTWLSGALEDSPDWLYGSVRVLGASRIGMGYGLSGRIHRVVVDTERGGSRSLVVKQEGADAAARELLFRSDCREVMRGSMPACFAGEVDEATGRGVLLLEDITPAEQGDVLQGCTETKARAALAALARLHAHTWRAGDDSYPASLPRWGVQPMERDRWLDRLGRASQRFPQILTPAVVANIVDLPARVAPALDHFRRGPASWIQGDTHLDNVLWRPAGTAVLLDWCHASIGPPLGDLARFLSEGVDEESRTVLASAYVNELRQSGVEVALAEVTAALRLARHPLLQGMVGWAGREDLPSYGRAADVCESALRRAVGRVLAESY
jgi:hypothetical protein